VVAFVLHWSGRTRISVKVFLGWLDLSAGKFTDWKRRQGQPNGHNGEQPKAFWLQDWERLAIIGYAQGHPLNGYRRLTYMMLDADVVAVSPSSVYRVLSVAGLLRGQQIEPNGKGEGFDQPTVAHQHWHTDVSYLNLGGTFYYLISVLDGYSRYLLHWDIRQAMRERDIEMVLQGACERFPAAKPRIITDNGPQYLSRDFREWVRLQGMTHVTTSPYYPQSNGKQERWHKSLKVECIRPQCPVSLADAKRLVADYVQEYNHRRLHSAIGYVTPYDKLMGREEAIFAARREKLAAARRERGCAYQKTLGASPQPSNG
jgi:putative transposase